MRRQKLKPYIEYRELFGKFRKCRREYVRLRIVERYNKSPIKGPMLEAALNLCIKGETVAVLLAEHNELTKTRASNM